MVEYARYPIVPCYYPLKGYRKLDGGITFTRASSHTGDVLRVPCGQCVGCRLEPPRRGQGAYSGRRVRWSAQGRWNTPGFSNASHGERESRLSLRVDTR